MQLQEEISPLSFLVDSISSRLPCVRVGGSQRAGARYKSADSGLKMQRSCCCWLRRQVTQDGQLDHQPGTHLLHLGELLAVRFVEIHLSNHYRTPGVFGARRTFLKPFK